MYIVIILKKKEETANIFYKNPELFKMIRMDY